ncbi:MAG: hypothetical protein WAU96_11310 [Anaerolineae bacterium]
MLLAGEVDANDVRRQLSRWARAGKIRQWRKGLYSLAPPYNKVSPHPFVIANAMIPGSYVSEASALAYYGLIPEYAASTTSVTLARPMRNDGGNDRGNGGGFIFHHLAPHLFFGYTSLELVKGQLAYIALPEKAILDLAHLTPASDQPEWAAQLRLQNWEHLDLKRLQSFAQRSGKPKWIRVAKQIVELACQGNGEYEEVF